MAAVLGVAVLSGCLSHEQATVQSQVNSARSAAHVGIVTDYDIADIKAQSWAQRLANDGYLHHSHLPDGYPTNWCHLGENVGMGPSLAAVQNAFMHSAPHRANILNPVYDRIGTGVARNSAGYYFVVQEFVDQC